MGVRGRAGEVCVPVRALGVQDRSGLVELDGRLAGPGGVADVQGGDAEPRAAVEQRLMCGLVLGQIRGDQQDDR